MFQNLLLLIDHPTQSVTNNKKVVNMSTGCNPNHIAWASPAMVGGCNGQCSSLQGHLGRQGFVLGERGLPLTPCNGERSSHSSRHLCSSRYDDYDYAEVNHLLERILKLYIKTVTCSPEKMNSEMFERFWKQFKHSEKVGRGLGGQEELWLGMEMTWAG